MASARGKNEIYSSPAFKAYTSFASNIDLISDCPVKIFGSQAQDGQPCRAIVCLSGGNIVVTMPNGTDVTITSVFAGLTLPIQAVGIKASGTTVTNALVLW